MLRSIESTIRGNRPRYENRDNMSILSDSNASPAQFHEPPCLFTREVDVLMTPFGGPLPANIKRKHHPFMPISCEADQYYYNNAR